MKKLLAMLVLLAAPLSHAQAQTVHFTTEDYPPYNFRADGGISGASYDQIIKVMPKIGIDYTIELMPWARAIALAEAEKDTCVFTTAHIPERNDRFKWIEPLALDRNFMVARKGSGVVANDLETARQFVVGTQRNDYTQAILERNRFPKVDLATNLDLTLKKLLAGRIDLMPMSELYFRQLEAKGEPLEAKFIFSQQTFSIACNIDFPADIQKKMQVALDEMIADGTQEAILARYGLGPVTGQTAAAE
ncbi:substrate-binding periplasmic protein [Rhizobium halophytocola]|uniref:Polar amino acid transport system substrate-binding protein n=1 Tax=Rhizobium halophytocola TaxID=735519 RepID=A0ABS4E3V8_9HYPH|nr:transporter substrate-binding domain-containing protein [Rhizobium halophytocola]MBP1852608.1 polar amino acid transport system substrate-binding protein [Rhizobium halophytocola]